MNVDRVAFDLPPYDGLLAGHYVRGQGYVRRRPGGTDDWLLVMTLSGEGQFGGDLAVENPSLVLIAPGTTHDYGIGPSAESWELLWAHFQPPSNWLELLRWPLAAPGIHILIPAQSAEIETQFREVVQVSTTVGPRRRRFAMNALERLLLLCDAQLPSEQRQMDSRVWAAIEYIHAHLGQTLTIEDLGTIVNLSPSRFAHLFRQETGLPPGQYILQQRIHRASGLLVGTTLGVAEIALEVGMDPFYLSLRFKADKGVSPRAYRRLAQV